MGDALHGDEGRRQAYLAALGIPLWGARVELPGALPAPALAFVPYVVADVVAGPGAPGGTASASSSAPAAEVPAVSAPAAAPVVAPSSAPATLSDRQASALQSPVPGLAGSPAAAAAAPAARPAAETAAFLSPVSADPPRLACRLRPLAPGWTAVLDLGDAPDLSAAEYRLLDSLARALGAAELPGAAGEQLRWPLNRNPALDHGREALRAWLRHALRLPPGLCLVFGEALAAELQAAFPGRPLVAGPSLGELLEGSAAKRRLLLAMAGQWPQDSHA